MTLEAEVRASVGDLIIDATFQVGEGEIVILLGPNGAGKSTLLHLIAGSLPLERGRIVLSGRLLEDPALGVRVPPERRSIGFVFQDQLLFPHLTVLENVAFGLRCHGTSRSAARSLAGEWLERLGAVHLAGRRPAAISGGEAQKVALARALAWNPQLLLLDEPLSALDAVARAELRRDLGRHLRAFPGTRLVVTHDPLEAMALGDRLIIFEGGRIVQSATPDELRLRPRSEYAADLVGLNLFSGMASGGRVTIGADEEIVTSEMISGPVFVSIHPRAVALFTARPEGTPRNVWAGSIDEIEVTGGRARVSVKGAVGLVAEITPAAISSLGLRVGDRVWAAVKASEVSVYPGERDQNAGSKLAGSAR
jgi:molybdate transport system ATP-binding protein